VKARECLNVRADGGIRPTIMIDEKTTLGREGITLRRRTSATQKYSSKTRGNPAMVDISVGRGSGRR